MKETFTVNEMVRLFLKERGYDGLALEECGCDLDDLFPCECANNCEAAYRYAFVQDPQHGCPEYAKCAESAEGCLSEWDDLVEFCENGQLFTRFFTAIKRDCRCRRPYAKHEAGNA